MGKKGASSSTPGTASGASSSNQASPPPPPSASSAVAAAAALNKRVAKLEEKQKKRNLFAIVRQKKDLLNAEAKSYLDNFLIKGAKFDIKDAQGDEDKEERFWERMVRIFVDQGLLPAKKVFVAGPKTDGRDRILRGVLRHCHPLGSKDNCSVVVAFLESWLVGQIHKKLTDGKRLKDNIRIIPHLPPILDALRNGALQSRRQLITATPGRKIIMKRLLRRPWIQLVETKDGRKKPIEFSVDDDRLVNPALTLARLEIEGKDPFTPKALLPADQQRLIRPGVVRPHNDDDDDVDADELDASLMDTLDL